MEITAQASVTLNCEEFSVSDRRDSTVLIRADKTLKVVLFDYIQCISEVTVIQMPPCLFFMYLTRIIHPISFLFV